MNQQDKVIQYLEDKPQASIKEVATATEILEPNIRRILGQGEKKGIFERLTSGVYRLKVGDKDLLYIHKADSLQKLSELAHSGLVADTIFLDIPYDTPAVKGGNRGVKYDLISVENFREILTVCGQILKNKDSKIIYMFSNATSGLKKMQKYTDCFKELGFHCVADGSYTKLWAGGKVATNMRGDIIKPEGIKIFSKLPEPLNVDIHYSLNRPKGYPTEKAAEMVSDLLQKTTEANGIVVDPFAGSGVVGIEAIKLNLQAVLIDNSQTAIDYIVNRINQLFK